MAKIRFEKADGLTLSPLPGTCSAVFYGYAYADGKRIGTIDRFKDTGRYRFAPDYDCRRERRRACESAPTLRDLRTILAAAY